MKKMFLTALLLSAVAAPAFAQSTADSLTMDAKNQAALKSLGPSLCETMRMLNDPTTAEALPARLDIPVSADDMKKYGATGPDASTAMTVSFVKGGHVLVNEQDVTPAIESLCSTMGGTHGAPQTPSSATPNVPGMQ